MVLIGVWGLLQREQEVITQNEEPIEEVIADQIERMDIVLPIESILEQYIATYLKQEELDIQVEEYELREVVKIEDIELSAQITGEVDVDYEVEVTVTRKAYPIEDIVLNYPYLYSYDVLSGANDLVRCKERYWITLGKETKKLVAIEPSIPFEIKRMAFQEDTQIELKERVKKGLQDLLEEDVLFFRDYKTYLEEDRGLAYEHLKSALAYSNRYLIDEQLLRQTYPTTLNPYEIGDQMVMDWNNIEVKPSLYSTKEQPRFDIGIQGNLLLNHYNQVYYKYNYFVGTEDGKIKWIHPKAVEQIIP